MSKLTTVLLCVSMLFNTTMINTVKADEETEAVVEPVNEVLEETEENEISEVLEFEAEDEVLIVSEGEPVVAFDTNEEDVKTSPSDLSVYQESNGDIVISTIDKEYLENLMTLHEGIYDEEYGGIIHETITNVIRIWPQSVEELPETVFAVFDDHVDITYSADEGKIVIPFEKLRSTATYAGTYTIGIESEGYENYYGELTLNVCYKKASFTTYSDTANHRIVFESEDEEFIRTLCETPNIFVWDENGLTENTEGSKIVIYKESGSGRVIYPVEEVYNVVNGERVHSDTVVNVLRDGNKAYIPYRRSLENLEGISRIEAVVPGYSYNTEFIIFEIDWGLKSCPEDLNVYQDEEGNIVVYTEDKDYLRGLVEYAESYGDELEKGILRIGASDIDGSTGDYPYYNSYDYLKNRYTSLWYEEAENRVVMNFSKLKYNYATGVYHVEVLSQFYKNYDGEITLNKCIRELPEYKVSVDYTSNSLVIESTDKKMLEALCVSGNYKLDGTSSDPVERPFDSGKVYLISDDDVLEYSNRTNVYVNDSNKVETLNPIKMVDGKVYVELGSDMKTGDYRVVLSEVPGYGYQNNDVTVHYEKQPEAKTYLIVYDGNGATAGDMETQTVNAGQSVNLTANNFTRTGYTFAGWSFEGKLYKDKASVLDIAEVGTTVNMVAQWNPVKYTIKYVLNGGSNPNSKFTSYTVESDYELLPAVKNGYTFTGWTDVNGDIISNTLGLTGNLVLNANFEIDTYKLVLSTNGGELAAKQMWPENVTLQSEDADSKTYLYGIGDTVKLPSLAKPGYKFDGWFKDVWNDKKNDYVPTKVSSVSKSTGDLEIYASFTSIKYPITYNVLSGKITSAKGTYTVQYGVDADELILPEVTRTGYRFGGWYRGYDSKTKTFTDPVTTIDELKEEYVKTTLFACWIPVSYNLTFTGEGLNKETVTVKYDEQLKLNDDIFNLPGKVVGKWTYSYTDAKGNVITKTVNGNASVKNLASEEGATVNFTVAKDKNNLEVWNYVNYTVTYAKTNGVIYNSKSVKSYRYSENEHEYLVYNPIKKGYNFIEWTYVDKEGLTRTLVPEDISSNGYLYLPAGLYQNIVLTPVFEDELAVYTITYTGELGSFASENPNPKTYQYSTSAALALANPVRDGYTFAGWYLNNKKISNIAKGTIDNLVLEARWTANKYKIVFNGNGANSGKMASQTIEYGKETPLMINAFARTGYVFAGWNTDPHGLGETYLNGEPVLNLLDKAGTVTLYAMWEDAGLSVTKLTRYTNGKVIDTTTYEYDAAGNAIRQTYKSNDMGTYICDYTYDSNGLLTEWTQTRNGKLSFHILYEYDENNRKAKETSLDENGDLSYSDTYEYDEAGNIVLYIYETPYSDQPSKTVYTYDELGRLLSKVVSVGERVIRSEETTYGKSGRKLSWSSTYGNETDLYTTEYDGNVEITYHQIIEDGVAYGKSISYATTFDDDGREIIKEWYDGRTGEVRSTIKTSYEEDGKVEIKEYYDENNVLTSKYVNTRLEDGGYVNARYDETGTKVSGICSDIRNSYMEWNYDKNGKEVITYQEVRSFSNVPASINSAENLPYMFIK